MNKMLPFSILSILLNQTYALPTPPEIAQTTLHLKELAAAPTLQTAPVQTTNPNNTPTAPVTTETPTPAVTPVIDCHYTIAPQTKNIDSSLILTWAEKASQQSFDYDYLKLDEKLTDLKACYTDAGWKSFMEALEKSGNLKAVKEKKLMVSSLVDGKLTINPIKDNQWKVTVPLQVVYQNDAEKLKQLLTVDLVIGRKTTGNLGIMQIIASPRNS